MTRVNIRKSPGSPYQVASIDVPVIVGDVPGAIVIRCAHESGIGALASAAQMAMHVISDPTVGAVVPDGALDDIDAVNSIAMAARAGYPTLHAASLMMTPGQRKLAAHLQREARGYGGPDDHEGREVGGWFDSVTSLAKDAVNSVVNAADPDHWPAWMKKLAKPVARATLDAAATAVFGPAGPAAVETMINVVDKARAGDADAAKQIESIAKKALKGDKGSKVLMSAVHASDGSTAAPAANELADAFGGYMDTWGEAYQPGAFGDDAENSTPMLPEGSSLDPYDPASYGGSYGGDEPYAQQGYYPEQGYPEQGYYPGQYADDGSQWPLDAQGNPWPADAQGNPVDPDAPQGPPPDVRAHAATKGNRGAGERGGAVTVTQGPPRGAKPAGGGGFKGARDNRSQGKPSRPSIWNAFGKHGGR